MSEERYRKSIQGQYFCDAVGRVYFREPIKNQEAYSDIMLMNFTPELVQLISRDDGFEVTDKIVFRAFRNGVYEAPVELDKKDILSNQTHAKFSPGCRILIGRGNCARCSEMMQMQCEDAEPQTVYTHTGWKVIEGQRVFLNGDYSVTAEGLSDRYVVELDPDLRRCYRFVDGDINEEECFQTVLTTMGQAAPDWLVVPSLAYIFMTPLNGMLRDQGREPSFSFYLIGKTGSYKSSWAKGLLGFVGGLGYAETAPITFLDTQNAIGRKLGLGADIPLLLDDRRPTSNNADKLRYETIEKYVSSAIGDRAARGRLNADSTARTSYIARCNLIITAEEAFQNIGSSAIARSVSVELRPDTINFDKLQELQEHPAHFNRVMVLYLQWLIAHYEEVEKCAADMLKEYREIFTTAGHPRLATAFSNLMLGYCMYLAFLQGKGRVSPDAANTMGKRAIAIFLEMCQKQSEKVEEEKPTKLFISLLNEMLETKKATICDLTRQEVASEILLNPQTVNDKTIGYKDECSIYLIPKGAYMAVAQYYGCLGYTFPASPSALWKQFKDEGKLCCDTGRVDKRKTINGKTKRYITMPISILIDDEEEIQE